MKRRTFLSLMGAAALTSSMMLTGCGAGSGDDRKIVRIGHVQSQTHPDHLGLEAFANYINEKLGDKYRVEVYPSELLGSQTEMVQLTQTGAIDFVVASTAIMETFSAKYQIFNLPYLFSSVEAYHEAMDDPEVTDPIFKTTSKAGLETVAWLDAGTRNFYTIKTPINQPSDLKGLKIRVQQSSTRSRRLPSVTPHFCMVLLALFTRCSTFAQTSNARLLVMLILFNFPVIRSFRESVYSTTFAIVSVFSYLRCVW